MKNYLLIVGAVLLVFFASPSCQKTVSYSPPAIHIDIPAENAYFQLPGFIEVQVTIASDQKLNYVRISIDNDQLTPISSSKYFSPDSNFVVINYDLYLDKVPDGQNEPFYVHVAVDDGIEVNHAFTKVQLSNAELVYKGFYLFSKPMPNQIQIDFFNTYFEQFLFKNLNGEYVDSDISSQQDIVYIATNKPATLYAIEFAEQNLQWTMEPLNPYPEYNDLLHAGNSLYAATGNGQISNLADGTGYVKVITPVLPDSVPVKIGVGDDFFISDYWVRNKPTRSWVSFYKITGQPFNRYSSDIEVVDFYQDGTSNRFSVMGNKDAMGIYLKYLVTDQSISDSFTFTQGEIGNSARLDEDTFLVTIDRRLYSFNVTGKSTSLIHEFPSEIVNIRFESTYSNLYVVLQNSIEIFSYPSMTELKTVQVQHPIKGIELRIGY